MLDGFACSTGSPDGLRETSGRATDRLLRETEFNVGRAAQREEIDLQVAGDDERLLSANFGQRRFAQRRLALNFAASNPEPGA